MNTQELVINALIRLATAPGLPLRLGIMLAAGIVAGYVLYRGTRDLWRWGILIVLFVMFEEWIRGTLIAAMVSGYDMTISVVLAAITLGVFGLAVGGGATIRAKCGREPSYEKQLQMAKNVAKATTNRVTEVNHGTSI